MEVSELLASSALFSHLSPAALYRLTELVQIHSFKKDDIIIHEGHAGVGCYIVARGSVEIIKGLNTASPVIISRLGVGEIIGEMAVIDDQPHSTSVRAAEETHCLMIERWDLKAQMQAYPEIALQLLPVLAKRIRDLLALHSSEL